MLTPMPSTALTATDGGNKKQLRVVGKLKTALDLMVWGDKDGIPLDYDVAARTANLTVRSMRRALERPHVRAYLRGQRDVFRASISSRVIFRLDELSRQNVNMNAAVGASRAILQLEDEEVQQRRGSVSSPGLVIQIVSSPVPRVPVTAGPIVDVTPATPAPAEPRELWINGQDEPVAEGVFRHPLLHQQRD